MERLNRDSLHLGGFAGLREHRLVTDKNVFGFSGNGAWTKGIGNFVYLADATFQPHGDTRMHPHQEVDIVSFMVQGRLRHEGSLGEGTILQGKDVQIQRAGGAGLIHNEINPDDQPNRMLQLWLLPDEAGLAADYQVVTPKQGQVTPVYGGSGGTLEAKTKVSVALFEDQMAVTEKGDFIAYFIQGKGKVDGQEVGEGDLVRGTDFDFTGLGEGEFLLVQ